MAKITITGGDPKTGILKLMENGAPADIIVVEAGEEITWTIESDQLSDITNIDLKTGKPEIFKQYPGRQINERWVAVIKDTLIELKAEYFISWDDNQTPPENHTYDPIIQVNPKIDN